MYFKTSQIKTQIIIFIGIITLYSTALPINIYVLNSLWNEFEPVVITYTRTDDKIINKLITPHHSPLYLTKLDSIKPDTYIHVTRGEDPQEMADNTTIPQQAIAHIWHNFNTDSHQDLLITINWRLPSTVPWWEKIASLVGIQNLKKKETVSSHQPFSERITFFYNFIPAKDEHGVLPESGNLLHAFPNIRYLESDEFIEYITPLNAIAYGKIRLKLIELENTKAIVNNRFIRTRISQVGFRLRGNTTDDWRGIGIYGGTMYEHILGLPRRYTRESIEDAYKHLVSLWNPQLFSSDEDKITASKIIDLITEAKNGLESAHIEGIIQRNWRDALTTS